MHASAFSTQSTLHEQSSKRGEINGAKDDKVSKRSRRGDAASGGHHAVSINVPRGLYHISLYHIKI